VKNFDKETLNRYLLWAAIILMGIVSLILLYYYLFPAIGKVFVVVLTMLLPFIIAWLVAILTKPLVDFLTVRCHFPKSLSVIVMMLIVLGLLGGIMTLIISRLVIIIRGFVNNMPVTTTKIMELFANAQDLFKWLDIKTEGILEMNQWMISVSDKLQSWLASFMQGFVATVQYTPTLLIFIIVTLLAVFFWCLDPEKVEDALVNLAPKSKRKSIKQTFHSFSDVMGGFCRAQLILVGISTLICIVAYYILRVEGAFAIGLLTGVVDILPVLGPGTIIIPWAIWAFVTGDIFMGVCLTVLYIVLIAVRNILQPHFIGRSVGLNPLATLAAIFIGLKLFGLWGLAIGPIAFAVIMALIRARRNTDLIE